MQELNAPIWVLLDDKAGHNGQSLGVAQALDIPYKTIDIAYNPLSKLPNALKGRSSLVGVAKSSHDLHAPWPDLVIATGRRLAPVSRYIKKQSANQTKICQIMWAGGHASQFDLIAVPAHDHKTGDNIITTIGAPNQVTAQKLANIDHDIQDIKRPVIALLVGGDTKNGKFTAGMAVELAEKVSDKVKKLGGSLLVTTSRRTSQEVSYILDEMLDCDYQFHNPHEDNDSNPYFAYLSLADAIIVTGESVSMCTEACATGKPVYIYAPEELMTAKYRQLHQTLYQAGYAYGFDDWLFFNPDMQHNVTPLNDAQIVANAIKSALNL